MIRTRPARLRRTLNVDQDITDDGSGKIRMREQLVAREESPDGTITEVTRETEEERSKESPWFGTGTRRTRTRRVKPV